MKVLPLYFTVFALLLNMPKSQAVIRGAELPIEQVSTLRVKIPIARRARGGGLNIYDGYCSSVVVGTKPLTLLLAAHCFMGAYVTGKPGDPEIEVDLSQIGSHQKLKIKDVAMSDQFWKSDLPGVGNDTSYDLAFMVFEDNLDHPKIKPIKISLNSSTTKSALICGYGYAGDEAKPSLPRCAEKSSKTLRRQSSFYQLSTKT